MSALKRLIITAALIAGIIPVISAQHIRPYSLTRDPAKLSQKLTEGLTNDTAKVLAIHDWITNNIKYDVKKWKKLDYSKVAVKKILHKRKAICTGYSDLFNELCTAAKIRSVSVPGYIKEIHVDSVDNFYLDEHIWNAVYMNDQWKLVDCCWDAGYIEYSRKTILGRLLYFITNGRHDILKYKPHFKKFPVHTYYNRQGKFFRNDHLALNPCWQLTNPVISIKKFKQDSAYYFEKYNLAIDRAPENTKDEAVRNTYYSMDESEKTIADGYAGTKFNARNQYRLGLAYTEMAENKSSDLKAGAKDTTAELALCDSINYRLLKAIYQYDSNKFLLLQQKQELTVNNKKKNKILSQQNAKLISSTNNILMNMKDRKPSCDKIRKQNTKFLKSYHKRLQKTEESNAFANKKFAKTTHINDSLKYENLALNYGDTLSKQSEKLRQHYILLDSLYEKIVQRTHWYSSNLKKIKSLEDAVIQVRFAFYDDYDYEIRSIKDTVLKYKFPNDSLLLINSYFFIKEINKELTKVRNEYSRHFRFYRIRAAFFVQFKGACVNNKLVGIEYAQNLANMAKDYDTLNQQMDKWASRLRSIKSFCQKQKSHTHKELKAYKKEKRVENYFYLIRKGYIDKHYKSLSNVNRMKMNEANLLLKNTEKIKKGLSKHLTITKPYTIEKN